MPAPNDLTPTRIPNAIIAIGYSDPYDTQSLRKVYNNNLSNIVIGPKKGHQYYFNPVNGNYSWRAGLTPGDNGYLNDGTSLGSTSADSPSRYAIISSFEWWDDYVIYCMGGHTTGPNGNDLEPAAVSAFPELGKWRDRVESAIGSTLYLAGSGSTWFADGHVHQGLNQIPDVQVVYATTRPYGTDK